MRKEAHARDSALAAGAGQKPRRGFTTIELAVSLGIFLLVSTFVTLAIARSIGEGAQARSERVAVEASNDALSVLASYPAPTLASGDFFVPYACDGTSKGISGASCPKGSTSRVVYAYRDASGNCPAVSADGTWAAGISSASAAALLAADGRIGLCAASVQPKSSGEYTVKYPNSVVRAYVAYTPGYDKDKGSVRVSVDMQAGSGTSGAPTRLALVKASDPTLAAVAAAQDIVNGQVLFTGLNPATQCTSAEPCQVALAAGTAPETSGSFGLFGPGAQPTAGIVSVAGQTVDTGVSIARTGTVKVQVRVVKKGATFTPGTNSSVCLTASIAGGGVSTACNSGQVIVFDSWTATQSGKTISYPIQAGNQVDVSVDSPDGTCPADSATMKADGSWTSGRVCTSWTWGQPELTSFSDSLPASSANAVAGSSGTAQLIATWPASTPAYGMNQDTAAWTKPRITPGCSLSGNGPCSPVQDVPEDYLCPEQNCLAKP